MHNFYAKYINDASDDAVNARDIIFVANIGIVCTFFSGKCNSFKSIRMKFVCHKQSFNCKYYKVSFPFSVHFTNFKCDMNCSNNYYELL